MYDLDLQIVSILKQSIWYTHLKSFQQVMLPGLDPKVCRNPQVMLVCMVSDLLEEETNFVDSLCFHDMISKISENHSGIFQRK